MRAMLAIMTPDGWQPGFGDDDFQGWLITAAYFVAAALCAWAWRGERALGLRDGRTARPLIWAGLVALLIGLGFNKQLDFQHWLIFTLRDHFAADPSLWSHRYAIGAAVGACAALGAAAGGFALFRYVGASFKRYSMAFVGLTYLGVFIFARAGSFLPVMSRINSRHRDAMHLLLELGSLVMIGVGAAQAIGVIRSRQRATRQDAMILPTGLRLTDAPTVALPADLQPAARQAA
jgi:hypothetical protein